MRNGGIWNSNIETDNFGVKDITSIQSEKMRKNSGVYFESIKARRDVKAISFRLSRPV